MNGQREADAALKMPVAKKMHTNSLQLLLLILGIFTINSVSSQEPVVTVEQGDIRGETITFIEDEFINVDKQINVFKGIPFAEPPVGELRFEPPVAKTPWEGVWDATYDRAVCHQSYDPRTAMFEKNEDCLFLTIYAPDPKVKLWSKLCIFFRIELLMLLFNMSTQCLNYFGSIPNFPTLIQRVCNVYYQFFLCIYLFLFILLPGSQFHFCPCMDHITSL